MAGRQAGRGEVGEYLAGFLFCCDAMVMPRKMGEGGQEGERRKEMGRGAQGVKSRGHAEWRMRGRAPGRGLGPSLLTARLWHGPAKVGQLVKVHQQ